MNEYRSLVCLVPPDLSEPLKDHIGHHGWDVHPVTSPEEAMEVLKERLCHVGLVHWDYLSTPEETAKTRSVLDCYSDTNWVALIPGRPEQLCEESKLIATHFYDFHTLPMDQERLAMTLGHAYGMAKIRNCHTQVAEHESLQREMVGRTPVMRSLYQAISKVAAIDLSVIIRGESGTGKELTAQAIHRLSNRANGPFIAVNCGALPTDLVQSELFGYEKGAFTGADRQRKGKIEAAQNGSLFLDEIGDLPLDAQTNLLRFLQEKTINRVGSHEQIPVDVRVIAATHVNLEKAVEEGRFREDLYYRLNVLHLELPALRERGDDVELLADYFLKKFASDLRPDVKGFSKRALDAIRAYSWPGNIREMVNRIQRAVVMSESRLISQQDLGLNLNTPNAAQLTLAQARAAAEKEAIESTLDSARNNVSRAAQCLGVSRVTLYRLMETHAINWQGGRNA